MNDKMKQTSAVEWLVSALDALDEQMKVAPKTTNYKSTRDYIIERAKAMESLRISEAHYEAYMNALRGIEDEYNDNRNEK